MNRMSRLAALIALTALGASAAPFNAAHIPANARWVLHLDADLLRTTDIGKALMDKLNTGVGGRKMNALATILGFDLRRDLVSCTMFGRSEQERDGVVLLAGRFKGEQIETLLKADDGYRAETHRGRTIHSWIDRAKKQRMYGSMLPDGGLLAGSSDAAIREAMDVLLAQAPSLQAQNPNALPLTTSTSPVFLMATADVEGLKRANAKPDARILQRAKAGQLALGEEGGQFTGRLQLDAADAQAARLLADAARGLLAMAQLGDDTDAATQEMLQGLQVDQQGLAVTLSLRMPAPKAAVWLRTQIEKDQQKKAAEAAAME